MNGIGKNFGYGKKIKRAVQGISFGLPKSECFGLLGVNGAGKTTTFKMITGEHSIGFGNIKIAGFDVGSDLLQVQKRIGYVPQFDALLGFMNSYEVLHFFAGLRGIAQDDIKATADRLVAQLDLTQHAHKPCQTYSGGNKRKLGVAVALIGDPEIILLDEPTTGMDPGVL